MRLFGALESLDPAVWRVVARSQVVLVMAYVIAHVCRGSAAPAVIIDHQIAGESHQPIGQAPGMRVVLVEGTVNAHENLLRQILGRFVTSGEPVGEVEDAP